MSGRRKPSEYVQMRLAEIAAENKLSVPPVYKRERPKSSSPRRRIDQPRHGTKKGFVYFVATADDEMMKIGFARNVSERLYSLQTGSTQRLLVRFAVYTYAEAEKILHMCFKDHRIRGEWFKYSFDMEELWDDFLDWQMFRTDVPMQEEKFFDLDEVRFICATMGQPWASSVGDD